MLQLMDCNLFIWFVNNYSYQERLKRTLSNEIISSQFALLNEKEINYITEKAISTFFKYV